MSEVAVKGNKFQEGTATEHIQVKKANPPTPKECVAGIAFDGNWYSGYWQGSVCYGREIPPQPVPDSTKSISAKINGTINEGSSNVFVGGKEVAHVGAKTTETDTYSLDGWTYVSGSHTNAMGAVEKGSATVFVNGKALSRKGDDIKTHAGSLTPISEGSSNVFSG